jgi:hypothetical protein
MTTGTVFEGAVDIASVLRFQTPAGRLSILYTDK